AVADPALGGGASRLHGDHQDAALRLERVVTHELADERYGLTRDAEVAAGDLALAQEGAGDELGGVDADREADAPPGGDHRGVHADDVAQGGDEGAAGVAGVQRGVRLHDVVDEAPGPAAQRPAEGADDARGDGALEAERIADRDDELTDLQGRRVAEGD